MKKAVFISITVFLLTGGFLSAKDILAQTISPGPSPTRIKSSPTGEDEEIIEKLKQIEILKEKIATKVAQVRDEEKGAIFGTIKNVTDSAITLATKTGEGKFNFSDDTLVFEFSGETKKESAADKLTNGLTISAFGYLNEDKTTILAKYIFIQEKSERITGKIADIDKGNFAITVKARDGDKIIDIEKNTLSTFYTKGKGGVKGGFSKFKVGDYLFVNGEKNAKEDNRYSALRIINIPLDVSLTPTATASPSPTLTEKISPNPS